MARKTKQPSFTRAELINASHVFNVKPEVIAGALYGVEEATKEEAEKRLKAFLKKGV
jgi:hypothetical protein